MTVKAWRPGFLWGLWLLLAVACSGAPASTPIPAATPLPPPPEVNVIIITQDLALGSNRMVFGLVDRDGMPLRRDKAQLRAIYLTPGQQEGEVRDTGVAEFKQWPAGPQGVLTATMNFDRTGFWQLAVDTTGPDGSPAVGLGAFEVKEKTETPSLGDPAPRSVTPTGEGLDDLSTITSSTEPDPDLYRLSIDQALDTGKPLVVVFATPAFCVSATCGPQVEIVSQVKEKFSDRANFIHVEVFENPHLIEGNRPTGGLAPAVNEWNLPSEPWTFIIDKQGKVHAKFEQFTTAEEIEAALREVL